MKKYEDVKFTLLEVVSGRDHEGVTSVLTQHLFDALSVMNMQNKEIEQLKEQVDTLERIKKYYNIQVLSKGRK